MSEDGKVQSGWPNYCQVCGRRYWVRAVDLGKAKARRFEGEESDVRHECREVSHAG